MSEPERKFLQYWTMLGGPLLVQEHKFHPTRKWRFDFAHLVTKNAFEIEGGVWTGGRHTSGVGFTKDAEKYIEAQFAEWTIWRLTTDQITAPLIERLIAKI